MTADNDPELLEMARHLQTAGGGRGRRSPLFRWMFKRADAFSRMLNEAQPSWESVAEAAAALRLTDGAGKPPTGERTRKTWFEVRRAKGWHLAQEPPRPAATTVLAPPVPAAVQPQRAQTAVRQPFKISTLKNLEK